MLERWPCTPNQLAMNRHDFVHVLFDGKIVKSGGKELAFELEEKGYDWIKEEIKS